MRNKRYIIISLAICAIFIIALVVYLYKKYDEYNYNQVINVINKFSQALVDKNYEKAATFLSKGPKGQIRDRYYVKESIDRFIDVAQNEYRRPDFKELKHFLIKSVLKAPESDNFAWNQVYAEVTFYSKENFQENLSIDMYLRLVKVSHEFKILDFLPPMGFSWPNDQKLTFVDTTSLSGHFRPSDTGRNMIILQNWAHPTNDIKVP